MATTDTTISATLAQANKDSKLLLQGFISEDVELQGTKTFSDIVATSISATTSLSATKTDVMSAYVTSLSATDLTATSISATTSLSATKTDVMSAYVTSLSATDLTATSISVDSILSVYDVAAEDNISSVISSAIKQYVDDVIKAALELEYPVEEPAEEPEEP